MLKMSQDKKSTIGKGDASSYHFNQQAKAMAEADISTKMHWDYSHFSLEELTKWYDEYAANGYDTNMGDKDTYRGPQECVNTVLKLFPNEQNRKELRVMDVGAGTGLVGELLSQVGFKHVHALDASEGMIKQAQTKNCYEKLICAAMGGDEDVAGVELHSYDIVVGVGCFTVAGQMPSSALKQMVDFCKPGGVIVLVMWSENLKVVPEYRDNWKPTVEQLEKEGKMKVVSSHVFPNYFARFKDGLVLTFKAL